MDNQLGSYFVVTSGYSENGGLVSKNRKGILFLAEGDNLYRQASWDEALEFHKSHPVLMDIG